MTSTSRDEEAIFHAARAIGSSDERSQYVAQACGDDEPLRARVEALLEAFAKQCSFDAMSTVAGSDNPSIAEVPGAQIGPYKLLEIIGEGGMGVVYMAQQTAPVRRMVALKIIQPGIDSRQVIARFEAERQALALMDHPNIAKVLDAGTTGEVRNSEFGVRSDEASEHFTPHSAFRTPHLSNGRPYFVMELVNGVSITTYCDEHCLTLKQRLELFTPVCQAVQHAHQKGVIHRDLKPSNVLIARYDGRPVPKVIDFGVAKATGADLTEATMFTHFGSIVGTLEYMSPEQAERNQLDVDTRSDIYSLGVLLYELLTGTTPLDRERLKSAAFLETLRVIKEDDPPRPSTRLSATDELPSIAAKRGLEPKKLSSLVRGELDWIVMKALDKDRDRRYQTASGLAEDVQHYLSDEPVGACPPSTAHRLQRYVRRNKTPLAAATVVAAALVLGTIASGWQAVRARTAEHLAHQRLQSQEAARRTAEQAGRDAAGERDLAQRRLYEARLAEVRASRHSLQAGRRLSGLESLAEATRLARQLKLDSSAWRDLRDEAIACLGLTDLRAVMQRDVELPDSTHSTRFDDDLIHYAHCDFSGNISIRRVIDDHELVRLLGRQENQYRLKFSPDGNLLAASGDSAPEIWDWRKKMVVFRFPHADYEPYAVAFSPDSQLLAIGRKKGKVSIFNVATGEEMVTLDVGARASDLAFSPDGVRLAVASFTDRQVQIRELETGKLLRKLPDAFGASSVAWHPDGRVLAAASNDFHIHLWNVESGHEQAVLRGHQALPGNFCFSSDGNLLSSWAYDGTVRLWNVWNGQEVCRLAGEFGRLSLDGRRVACLRGARLHVLEVVGGHEHRTLSAWEISASPDVYNTGAGLSPEGRWLAVSSNQGIRLLDLRLGGQVAFLTIGLSHGVIFHPLSGALFGSTDKDTYCWSLELDDDELSVGSPRAIGLAAGSMSFDQSGDNLALAARPGAVVLDPQKSQHNRRVLNHMGATSVSISPDGRWVATAPHHGVGVKVWDAASGKLVHQLLDGNVRTQLAFSPNGHELATCNSTAITFWDVGTWSKKREIPLVGDTFPSIAWDTENRLFAYTISRDRVQLQDAATGRALATLVAPYGLQASRLVFTPHGDKLVQLATRPASVHLWDLRLVREQLAQISLDWDAPPYLPLPPAESE